MSHPHVPHPRTFIPEPVRGTAVTWDDRLLDWMTDHFLASRVVFNIALIVPLLVIPLSTGIKVTLGVISGSWIQWWALHALQRRSNSADARRDAKADADHIALTHIASQVDAIAVSQAGRAQIAHLIEQTGDLADAIRAVLAAKTAGGPLPKPRAAKKDPGAAMT